MSRITKSKSLTNRPSVLQSIRAVDEHLKDLHRLKTQVEELDIIRVPHKQPPVTRQIRELMDVSSQILSATFFIQGRDRGTSWEPAQRQYPI